MKNANKLTAIILSIVVFALFITASLHEAARGMIMGLGITGGWNLSPLGWIGVFFTLILLGSIVLAALGAVGLDLMKDQTARR